MRAVTGAVCIAGASLVLQGCGGGGGGTTPAPGPAPTPAPAGGCADLTFVTGTYVSTAKVTAKADGLPIPGTVTMNEKVDMEKFNMFYDAKVDMGALAKIELKLVADSAKQQSVVKKTQALAGQPATTTCLIYKIQSTDQIKAEWEQVEKSLQANVKCMGTDGKTDSWHFGYDHKAGDPVPPGIPFPIPADAAVKVDMAMKTTKDHLPTTLNMELDGSGTVQGKKQEGTLGLQMTFTDTSTTGPTEADLDYSSWGNCVPAPAPPPAPVEMEQPVFPEQLFQGTIPLVNMLLETVRASQKKEIVV